jgi:hypothetical protein
MQPTIKLYAGIAIAVGLVASGCASSSDSGAKSSGGSAPSASAAPNTNPTQLQSLVPVPAGSNHTDGPDTISDNGIHLRFVVNSAPADVMSAYKAALAAKGWAVTTIVSSTGGPSGGGGATYTGTKGENYGVFDGGGWSGATYINVCAWPTKPAEPNCSRSNQK